MKTGLLERIQSVGHWRVNIRPAAPLQERLSLQRCAEEVERARVLIRGWDYPHVGNRQDDQGGSGSAGEYFEGWCDWQDQQEFWRMYRSGQFLSYNALGEDGAERGHNRPQGPILEIVDTIYTVSEFVEFAHRLHDGGLHRTGSWMSVSLLNTRGRQLWVGPNRVPFFDPHRTDAESLEVVRTFDDRDWQRGSVALALEILLEIFDHFGWNPDPGQIRVDQEKFFRREFW